MRDHVEREGRGAIYFIVSPRLGTPLSYVLADSMAELPSRVRGKGKYYIGVTQDPVWRFWGPEDFKHCHTWKTMFVLAVSTGSGIKFLETAMLANPRIGLGHFFCTNKGAGAEGVARNPDPEVPYFLYVVFGDRRVSR